MDLTLLVVRTTDIEKLAGFYRLLGVEFSYHKHGNGPFHYAATIGQTVLEIYPLASAQTAPDKNLRLGFAIEKFDDTVDKLKSNNVSFAAAPSQTDFGFMVVVSDPDGRKVELYKK